MPVGVVQAVAQLVAYGFESLRAFAAADQGLQAADLQLHVGQCLGQRVMQFAGDGGALVEQQQAMFLLALAFERQRRTDLVGQRLDQRGFPGLRSAPAAEVGFQLAQVIALVVDAEDGLLWVGLAFAGGAIAARADLAGFAAMQSQQLLARGVDIVLQAQGQAQAR
ncbi:hypothetical protein D3C71_1534430 [compost metagenome]